MSPALAASIAITGKIVDQNGNGVQGVTVTATDPGGTTVDFGPTTSAQDGSYELDVDPGTYDLHFDPPSGSGLNPIVEPSFTASENQVLDVQLTPPAPTRYTVSGFVEDSAGNPVPDVFVGFHNGQVGQGAAAFTDDTGFYSVTLPDGDWQEELDGGRQVTTAQVPPDFSLTSTQNLTVSDSDVTQNFQLPADLVAVTANDVHGNPVPNASVWAIASGTTQIQTSAGQQAFTALEGTSSQEDGTSTSTDTNGTASFYAFPGLTYPTGPGNPNDGGQTETGNEQFCIVGPTKACLQNPITITDATGLTFTLPAPVVTYTVSGFVEDSAGNPVPDVFVGFHNGQVGQGAAAFTDDTGFYSVTLPDGDWQEELDGGRQVTTAQVPPDFSLTSTQNLTVSDSDVTQNFQLPADLVAVTANDVHGNPVPNASVWAIASGTTQIQTSAGQQAFTALEGTSSQEDGTSTSTDTNGTASFYAFPGLTYPTGPGNPNDGGQTETGNEQFCIVGPTKACLQNPITITDATGLTFTLPAPVVTYTVSGFVEDSAGNPVPDVFVGFHNGQVGQGAAAFTDDTGFYSVTLPDGDWQEELDGGRQVTTAQVPPDFSLTSTQNLTVSDSDVTQNFQLPADLVAVTANDVHGNPVPNASVWAIASGTTQIQTSAGQQAFTALEGTSSQEDGTSTSTDTNGTASFYAFPGLTYPTGPGNPNDGGQTETGNEQFCIVGPTKACLQNPITINSPANLVFQVEPQITNTPPTDLSATTPTNQDPALTWNPVPGAADYNIYRDGVLAGNVTATAFTDTSVKADGSYNYTVTAVDADQNESIPSSAFTIVFDQTPPVLGAPSWDTSTITVGQTANLTVPASDNLSGVIGGEYYIGSADPGQGNGTAMAYDGSNIDAALGSELAPGTYAIHVRAEDAAGNWSAITTTSLVVNPAGTTPTFTSPSTAIVGTGAPFSFTVTTTGSPAPTLTYTGTLPAGLTFTDNGDGTASVTGNVTGAAGTYPLTITATNDAGSATQDFVLNVNPVTITSAASDTESFGLPFSFTVTTTGSPAPAVTKTGGLPPGVRFTDNGDGTATIAGTPTGSASGPYTLTIKAKNSAGSATQIFVLSITKSPVLKNITNKTAHVGAAFSMNIAATGSTTPSLKASGLPASLNLADHGDGTGTISGTPSAGSGGEYFVTVTATNSLGSASKTFTIKIDEGPAITSPSSATATVGSTFSFTVTSAGFPAPSISKSGTLPKGISFKASTATFSGTPKAGSAGTYTISITAKNSTGTITQNLTLTVQ